ncbi:hypothetical protein Vafri_14777 [Volvox africanus]|uniref:Uncharacterized protein n=1 Tax=Volvox africanus TaxID=51714 RepID=A0A8J4F747_9CHLO|nr:hypothetical protein Vafri_14777 [Volvox africanus]
MHSGQVPWRQFKPHLSVLGRAYRSVCLFHHVYSSNTYTTANEAGCCNSCACNYKYPRSPCSSTAPTVDLAIFKYQYFRSLWARGKVVPYHQNKPMKGRAH